MIARKSGLWPKNTHKGRKYAFSDVLRNFLPFTDQNMIFLAIATTIFQLQAKKMHQIGRDLGYNAKKLTSIH